MYVSRRLKRERKKDVTIVVMEVYIPMDMSSQLFIYTQPDVNLPPWLPPGRIIVAFLQLISCLPLLFLSPGHSVEVALSTTEKSSRRGESRWQKHLRTLVGLNRPRVAAVNGSARMCTTEQGWNNNHVGR